MNVLIDVNLSPDWATFLNSAGIPASHWSSLGPTDTADSEIIAYARRTRSVILTRDLDYGIILSAGRLFRPSGSSCEFVKPALTTLEILSCEF